MKRAGNLWPGVLTRDNLLRAYHQAARGKRHKVEVRRFAGDLDGNLERLRAEVAAGTFAVGQFHVFKVYEPKERTIHAARFAERVFHHALMNVCEPFFERQAVFHTYACRVGKGRLKAIRAAERAARGAEWYLKLDIRRYFESVPQERLIGRLRRVCKDRTVLAWFERIIRSHTGGPGAVEGGSGVGAALRRDSEEFSRRKAAPTVCGQPGHGLPIGSLTSQHLANFYLNGLDRHCQAQPGVTGYARYMDDFVCWSREKAPLLAAGRSIRQMVEQELGLALKHPPCPQRTALGMDFLGYRIHRSHTTLARRSKVRYRRKARLLGRLEAAGAIAERGLQQRLCALTAFCLPVRSWGFRRRTLLSFRSAAIGLQPGDSGRQLGQQRQQRALCVSQQQHPVQPQQQRGLPPGPQLRPAVRDSTDEHTGLNRPPSGPVARAAGKGQTGRVALVGLESQPERPTRPTDFAHSAGFA